MAWLNFIRVGMATIGSSLGVALVFVLLEKYALKPQKNQAIVRPSILFLIIGFINIGICALMVWLSITQNKMYLFIAIGPIIIISLWLILRGTLWKITIDEDGIVFRNTLGKTKKILYSEITEIKDERLGFVIVAGKKKIGVDMFNSNFSELRAALARNCQKEFFEQRHAPKLSKKERKKKNDMNYPKRDQRE